MKKILTLSALVLGLAMVLGSCTKRDYYDNGNNNNNNNEKGKVDYISTNPNSPFIVIYMYSDGQYAVARAWENDAKYWPEKYDIIYGNFAIGTRNFINQTFNNTTVKLEIIDFSPNEANAINLMYSYEHQDGYSISNNKQLQIQRSGGRVSQ